MHTDVLSFYEDFLLTLVSLCLGSTALFFSLTDPYILRPLRDGTRPSLSREVTALADMSAKLPTFMRPILNRAATGLRPAAVGRLRGLFGDSGALTSCA